MSYVEEMNPKTGLTQKEEWELKCFCIGDDYPRTLRLDRTGTTYILRGPVEANILLMRLKGKSYSRAYIAPITLANELLF
jgi:hypothetical protein